MTPQEKGRELVDKFDLSTTLSFNKCKECALISVEQILNLNTWCDKDLKDVDQIDTIEFWEQVKKEIEKL